MRYAQISAKLKIPRSYIIVVRLISIAIIAAKLKNFERFGIPIQHP